MKWLIPGLFFSNMPQMIAWRKRYNARGVFEKGEEKEKEN
jgi:hypothetical protein